MPEVARISVTPVKGFRLAHPDEVQLTEQGVPHDRVFSLIWEDGSRVRSSLNGWHGVVEAGFEGERLAMRFPDGSLVEGDAGELGEELSITFEEAEVTVHTVEGPWNEPLSRLAGKPVRLVRAAHPNAGKDAPVSLVSDGSIARFEREAGRMLDQRRFRMLFELTGCAEHRRTAGAVAAFASAKPSCASCRPSSGAR